MKDLRNSPEYSQWKNEVKKRDGNACRRCGFENNLHVHHIKLFKKYPEFAIELDNGLTLCGNCHSLLRGKEESTDIQTFLGDDTNIGEQLKAIDGNFSNYLQRKLRSKTQRTRDSAASALFSHLRVYPNSLGEMLPLLIYIVDNEDWADESTTKRQAIGWLEKTQSSVATQTISRHEKRVEGQRILKQWIAAQEQLRQENEKREAEEKRQQEIISKYGSLEAYERHQRSEDRKEFFWRYGFFIFGGLVLLFIRPDIVLSFLALGILVIVLIVVMAFLD